MRRYVRRSGSAGPASGPACRLEPGPRRRRHGGRGRAARERRRALAARLAERSNFSPRRATTVPPALLHGRFYHGTPAVGALFSLPGGQLGRHSAPPA
jgi:hypothetical protein